MSHTFSVDLRSGLRANQGMLVIAFRCRKSTSARVRLSIALSSVNTGLVAKARLSKWGKTTVSRISLWYLGPLRLPWTERPDPTCYHANCIYHTITEPPENGMVLWMLLATCAAFGCLQTRVLHQSCSEKTPAFIRSLTSIARFHLWSTWHPAKRAALCTGVRSGHLIGLLALYPAVFRWFLTALVEMALFGIQLSLKIVLLKEGQRWTSNNALILWRCFTRLSWTVSLIDIICWYFQVD